MRAGFLYTFFSFCYSSQTVTEWTNQKGKHAASILFPLILKSAGMLCFTMYMWKMLTDWVNWDTSWSLINRRSVFGKLTSRALGHHLVVWPCYLLTQHNCFFRLRLIFFPERLFAAVTDLCVSLLYCRNQGICSSPIQFKTVCGQDRSLSFQITCGKHSATVRRRSCWFVKSKAVNSFFTSLMQRKFTPSQQYKIAFTFFQLI